MKYCDSVDARAYKDVKKFFKQKHMHTIQKKKKQMLKNRSILNVQNILLVIAFKAAWWLSG